MKPTIPNFLLKKIFLKYIQSNCFRSFDHQIYRLLFVNGVNGSIDHLDRIVRDLDRFLDLRNVIEYRR